jgi:small-conductance mechanosensitive channel
MMDSIRDRLVEVLGVEQLVLLVLPAVLSYLFYKVFLRNLSQDRHRNLQGLFRRILNSFSMFAIFWSLQFYLQQQTGEVSRFFVYCGIAAIITGALFFVRTVKVIVFEYLFINSMKMGVPVLLVDLVVLVFSLFIAAWISTSIFGVRWAPLLATSAIVSVVLGLALQETLGNLFAGIALQLDKPYEIGDWVEVHTDKSTFMGLVHEINWRSTTLYGLMDEVVILPNRVAAGSQISNFSARNKPVYRGVSVYMDVNAPDDEVKKVFEDVLRTSNGVRQDVEHFVMLRELSANGAHWRIVYPVADFNFQFQILDGILLGVQRELKKRGFQIARIRSDIRGTIDNANQS